MFKRKKVPSIAGKDIYLSSTHEVVKVKVLKVNNEYIFFERYKNVPNRQMDIDTIRNDEENYFTKKVDLVAHIKEYNTKQIQRHQEIINKIL